MIFGILIPTMVSRRDFMRRLMARLEPQLTADVGIFPLEDKGQISTGAKRQRLLETCPAEFVAHVDDDDLVAKNYVSEVLAAIAKGCDVVGFRGRYYEDDVLRGYLIHSFANERWEQHLGPDGLYRYVRTPNHLNPTRRSMALQVGFIDKTVGEDADYSRRLQEKFGSTMKEVFVDQYLYDYYFRTRVRAEPPYYNKDGTLTRAGMEKAIAENGSIMMAGRIFTTIEQLDEMYAAC